MVAMVVNNDKKLQFRVLWKFPKMALERNIYHCSSLTELSRILYHSEGIKREAVEYIYVHQVDKEGNAIEIIAFDTTKTNTNINPHLLWSDTQPEPRLMVPLAPVHEPDGERIMNVVYNLLKKQSGKKVDKPHIKMKAPPRTGMITAGQMYHAYPAPKGVTNESGK